jgi:hypothetical protein
VGWFRLAVYHALYKPRTRSPSVEQHSADRGAVGRVAARTPRRVQPVAVRVCQHRRVRSKRILAIETAFSSARCLFESLQGPISTALSSSERQVCRGIPTPSEADRWCQHSGSMEPDACRLLRHLSYALTTTDFRSRVLMGQMGRAVTNRSISA